MDAWIFIYFYVIRNCNNVKKNKRIYCIVLLYSVHYFSALLCMHDKALDLSHDHVAPDKHSVIATAAWRLIPPNSCFKSECFLHHWDFFLKLVIVVFALYNQNRQIMCVCHANLWFYLVAPEMKRDWACATSKHQSRLRCRWTLCPFIEHALNHLAVISLASGEGLCGYLTSCSLTPVLFSQCYWLHHFLCVQTHFLCQITCLSGLTSTWYFNGIACLNAHNDPHPHKGLRGSMGSGCHDNWAHQNPTNATSSHLIRATKLKLSQESNFCSYDI